MKIEPETKEESRMSFDALEWATQQDTNSVYEYAVLMALANRQNKKSGKSYPAISTIQKDTSIGSRSSIIRAINALEKRGLVTRTRTPGKVTIYSIPVSQVDRSDSDTSVTETPDQFTSDTTPVSQVDRGSVSGGPEPVIEPRIEPKKKQESSTLSKSQTEAFDKFWTAYPRKVAKGQARKAWKKLPKSVTVDQLIAAIEAQLADRASAPRGSFVPEWKNPSTWLNGECWTDEMLFANQLALPASDPDDEIYEFDSYYPPPRIAWQNAQNDAGLTTYEEIDSPELQNRLKNVNAACSRHFSEPSRLRPLLFAKTAENGSESPQIVFPSKIVLEEFKRLVFDLREVEPENEAIQAPFDAAVGKVKEGKDQSNG